MRRRHGLLRGNGFSRAGDVARRNQYRQPMPQIQDPGADGVAIRRGGVKTGIMVLRTGEWQALSFARGPMSDVGQPAGSPIRRDEESRGRRHPARQRQPAIRRPGAKESPAGLLLLHGYGLVRRRRMTARNEIQACRIFKNSFKPCRQEGSLCNTTARGRLPLWRVLKQNHPILNATVFWRSTCERS